MLRTGTARRVTILPDQGGAAGLDFDSRKLGCGIMRRHVIIARDGNRVRDTVGVQTQYSGRHRRGAEGIEAVPADRRRRSAIPGRHCLRQAIAQLVRQDDCDQQLAA